MERSGASRQDDAQGAEEARSLAMLIGADGLPGAGWRVSRDRTWVTGELDPDSAKSKRAKEAGGVTAWRSFEQTDTGRTAWVEVVPYATVEDAEVARQQSPRFFVGADQPDERVVSGGEVTGRELPGVADLWVYEKSVAGAAGVRVSRYAAGVIGKILCIASCAGDESAWSVDDVLDLASGLADRVRAE